MCTGGHLQPSGGLCVIPSSSVQKQVVDADGQVFTLQSKIRLSFIKDISAFVLAFE